MPDSPCSDESQRYVRQYNEIAALAGGLAHEIRNPLSTIRLNLELMQEEIEESDPPGGHRLLRKLRTIQQQCGHLDEILEAFLQFATVGELNLEDVALGEFLRQFLDFYKPVAEQHRIEIRAHLAGDLPVLRLDPRLVRQVLDNLVRNAQQAMPQGGVIDLQAYQRGATVTLEIIDTGSGIPAAAAPRIFDVFYSTKPAGSGLGLPTVRKIVEAHGGSIGCESEPGKGTKFTICFPAKSA